MKSNTIAAIITAAILGTGSLLGGCAQNAPARTDSAPAAENTEAAQSSGIAATAENAGEDLMISDPSIGRTDSAAEVSESTKTMDEKDVADADAATAENASDAGTGAAAADSADSASADTAAAPAEAEAEDAKAKAPLVDEDGRFSAEGRGLVIVLDPGHSQQVPGTTEPVGPGSTEMKEADTEGAFGKASGLHEYELTMKVCRKLRTELEGRGYDVKLTHPDTVQPISCAERAQVANENRADAFIRIHANSTTDPEVNGAMAICISGDSPYHPELYAASRRLSDALLDAYCGQTGAKKERVWETDTMTGNNWSEVPATILELGYMSNPDEDLMMAQDSYQKKMVEAIADGLDDWFARMPQDELDAHPALSGLKAAESAQ